MKKGFITAQSLLERWPTKDLGELLEILDKSLPVGVPFSDEFLEKHGEYRFFAWHPLAYRPIRLTGWISTPPKIYNHIPFEIDGIKEIYPYISQCLFSMDQVEKLERIFPELRAGKAVQANNLPMGIGSPTDNSKERKLIFQDIGRIGGQKTKENKPILEAARRYLQNLQNDTQKLSNERIARKFCNKYKEDSPISLTIENTKWEVFCRRGNIISRPRERYDGGKAKNEEKQITYMTFWKSYIPKAKKEVFTSKS